MESNLLKIFGHRQLIDIFQMLVNILPLTLLYKKMRLYSINYQKIHPALSDLPYKTQKFAVVLGYGKNPLKEVCISETAGWFFPQSGKMRDGVHHVQP